MKASILVTCLLASSFLLKAQTKDTVAAPTAPSVIFQSCLDKPLVPDFYKGKFLVLDFWATWCAPCIAGFPHFNELADKYASSNVLFAAITEDRVAVEQKFFDRTQKQLKALRLSDTSRSTFDAFKVLTIPHCYVIGPDNTVRWEGNTYDLTADILAKITHNQSAMPVRNVSMTTHIAIPSKSAPRPLFYFNVSEADTSKKISETSGSWASYNGVMTSYSSPKVRLDHFLQELTGFSASSRIVSNDMLKLEKAFAIDFTVGRDSALYKSYANVIYSASPRKNYIIATLGNALRFDTKLESKKVKHYELVMADTAKLHSFRSMQTRHSSMDDDHLPKLEIAGHNLHDIVNYIEASSKTIISADNLDDKSWYDVSLNVADVDSLKKSLQFYGLDLKEVNSGVDFLSINFY